MELPSTGDYAHVVVRMDTGTIDNPDKDSGVAHFLEHMNFGGFGAYETAFEIKKAVNQKCGNHLNAFTTSSATVYSMEIPASELSFGVDTLLGMCFESHLTERSLENEKRVITQEIGLREGDLVKETFAALASVMWGEQHPYTWDTLGTREGVGALDLKQIRAFRDEHYTPERAIISVAGNVTHEEVMRAVEDSMPKRTHPGEKKSRPKSEFIGGENRKVKEWSDHLTLNLAFDFGSHSTAPDTKQGLMLEIFDELLGSNTNGMGALELRLRDEKSLTYFARSRIMAAEGNAALTISTRAGYENAEEIVKETCKLLRDFPGGVSEDDFAVAKKRVAKSRDRQAEPSRVTHYLAGDLCRYGRVITSKDIEALAEDISLGEFREFAKEVLGGKVAMVAMGKQEALDKIPSVNFISEQICRNYRRLSDVQAGKWEEFAMKSRGAEIQR